jgi:DNA polymerase III epsilon subunit family exonuclease
LWSGLLQSILSGAPGVVRRPDARWTLTEQLSTAQELGEFVVLDVETTGLKAHQHRIIEIAVIVVGQDGEQQRWTTLVNPERRIPDYIVSVTGIDDLKVANAPKFRSVAPTVVELIGERPIVGHNVDFDIGFVNAELRRHEQPRLVNISIDTLALADVLLPDARRLDLNSVAARLGISRSMAHRAMSDAETTLAVLELLRVEAAARGLGTVAQLQELAAGGLRRRRRPAPDVGRGRAVVDRSLLDGIPHEPGVYIMLDGEERVIYVGKAKDLRKRVSSYYSQPLGYTRKMDGLLESISAIETVVVGSELEALLLESQLIRRYRPRFNTVQRNVEQYVFVKVDTANQWPTVTLARDRAEDGARYFGPFRSSRQARDAVALINDILPLRTCRRSFKDARSLGSPCIELSLRRCLGPCVGQADREQYRAYVNLVLSFFGGDRGSLLAHLHEKLADSARHQHFERAARLRDQIARLDHLALEQAQLDNAALTGHALLVLPGAGAGVREVWYLLRGQRWAQLSVEAAMNARDLADRLRPIRERALLAERGIVPHHHSVDETSIIQRWLQRTPEHPAYLPWPPEASCGALALRALNVDLSLPFGEGGRPAEAAPTDDGIRIVRAHEGWNM